MCYLVTNVAFSQKKFTDTNINNLFYGNSTQDISKMWFLDETTAIGTRRFYYKREGIKNIVLIKHGIIVDSVSLFNFYQLNDYYLGNVSHCFPVNKNQFLLLCGTRTIVLTIQENKLIPNKLSREQLLMQDISVTDKVKEEYPNLLADCIGKVGDYLIGYERKVKSEKKQKLIKDSENFPLFWVAKLESDNIVKKWIKINKESEIVTKDLFFDIRDWDKVWARNSTFQQYFNFNNDKIFFNVVRSNKLYVFDTSTENSIAVNYPEINEGESCFYYFDYVDNKSYYVKKIASNQFEIFLIQSDFKSCYLIKKIDFMPFAIVRSKIHKIERNKENGKIFTCHYLIPFNSNTQEKAPILLEEVKIKH